jgi:hypothetical protein
MILPGVGLDTDEQDSDASRSEEAEVVEDASHEHLHGVSEPDAEAWYGISPVEYTGMQTPLLLQI